jgi:hypothetical protein
MLNLQPLLQILGGFSGGVQLWMKQEARSEPYLESTVNEDWMAPLQRRPSGKPLFPAEDAEGDEVHHHHPQPNQPDLRRNLP